METRGETSDSGRCYGRTIHKEKEAYDDQKDPGSEAQKPPKKKRKIASKQQPRCCYLDQKSDQFPPSTEEKDAPLRDIRVRLSTKSLYWSLISIWKTRRITNLSQGYQWLHITLVTDFWRPFVLIDITIEKDPKHISISITINPWILQGSQASNILFNIT